MPEPWDQERITIVLQALAALIDEFDLSDDEADTLCDVVPPKLQQASGMDVFAFRDLAWPWSQVARLYCGDSAARGQCHRGEEAAQFGINSSRGNFPGHRPATSPPWHADS
jgi:hypothetical protein